VKIFRKICGKIISVTSIYYIELVYKTSKIIRKGLIDLLESDDKEKVVIVFWHGDSYCLYPVLKGKKLHVITTKDRRGDYISLICKYFGYDTIRIPDESKEGHYLFKIVRTINKEDETNLAIAIDGPLGPYHVPKSFAFVTALLAKRKVMPVTIKIKRKIEIKSRWDNYKIPLPFNKIEIYAAEPIDVTKEDMKDNFMIVKNKIKDIMEKW
jgi:lysophospholipid acyltransferase (LPLAT)-like uncharacterized protein